MRQSFWITQFFFFDRIYRLPQHGSLYSLTCEPQRKAAAVTAICFFVRSLQKGNESGHAEEKRACYSASL